MKLKNIILLSALAIIFAAFLWAADGVILTPWVTDLGLTDVPTFVFMLHATASLFLTYLFIKKKEELKNLDKKDWLAFSLTALFGGALGTMAIIAAIINVYQHNLNISVVLLLQKLQPIFAIILAAIILRERPSAKFYFWAGLAIAGSYFLTFGFSRTDLNANGMLWPAALSLIAAFSFGASTVFSKRAIKKVSHGLGTALRFYLTAIIMLALIITVSIIKHLGFQTSYAGLAGFQMLNMRLILAFIVIALTTGGTAIFIYYWGLKRTTASRSTIYELMFPVSSIFLEYLIHHKILSPGQWVGAIIVVMAIYMITKLKNKKAAVLI